jgi:hypothetical protein
LGCFDPCALRVYFDNSATFGCQGLPPVARIPRKW